MLYITSQKHHYETPLIYIDDVDIGESETRSDVYGEIFIKSHRHPLLQPRDPDPQKQKGLETLEMVSLLFSAIILLILFNLASALHRKIPTTLDGSFEPVTVPFDQSLRGNAIDLQISDANHDSLSSVM
ncbi:hypothetical protein LOK49_LG07G00629 [Camellia lanceoleosa]|uniref:Uncharacterized protein n=1 Tax=Camellia lanceoleosa TaxID=1840588 RepID=A0ACC0H4V3_9ERIC|nr:hypothetical protein LOK49_LG07G00629 [Camellia lanceoleosa]